MISEKAEKLMSDLRHVVHSVSGTDDPYFSAEFEIRMYFLANYLESLELKDARQTAQIAEAEEHVLDAEAEYFHIAERLDAKEQEVSEYKACCEGLLNLLLMVNKTNMTLLLEKCEYKEVIAEVGEYIDRLIDAGNKLANVWSVRGLVETDDWNDAASEWEGEK